MTGCIGEQPVAAQHEHIRQFDEHVSVRFAGIFSVPFTATFAGQEFGHGEQVAHGFGRLSILQARRQRDCGKLRARMSPSALAPWRLN